MKLLNSSVKPLVLTHIVGKNVFINEQTLINWPSVSFELDTFQNEKCFIFQWFWWSIVGGSLICCLSCMVWIVSSLLFLRSMFMMNIFIKYYLVISYSERISKISTLFSFQEKCHVPIQFKL